MAVVEKNAVLTVKDEAGNTYILKPYTSVDQVEGAVASINGSTPNDSGAVTVDVGVKTINAQKPDESGNLNIDAASVGLKVW